MFTIDSNFCHKWKPVYLTNTARTVKKHNTSTLAKVHSRGRNPDKTCVSSTHLFFWEWNINTQPQSFKAILKYSFFFLSAPKKLKKDDKMYLLCYNKNQYTKKKTTTKKTIKCISAIHSTFVFSSGAFAPKSVFFFNEMFRQRAWNERVGTLRTGLRSSYSPSSLIRCCLLRRESRSKEKSDHSSRGGKEMVWRRVKRTASMTRSPRASEAPTLTVEAPLVVRTMCGGGEKSMACRCSMMPFQMMCWNSAGIFSLDRS